MDNNTIPPLEPDRHLPEVLPEIPERMEPLEDLPVIEDLSFEPETPPTAAEQTPEELPFSDPLPEDITFPEEILPLEEPPVLLEEQFSVTEEEVLPESEIPADPSESDIVPPVFQDTPEEMLSFPETGLFAETVVSSEPDFPEVTLPEP